MPCGGIIPLDQVNKEERCLICDKSDTDHFCEEWDSMLHVKCATTMFRTDEGKILISHGHEIVLDFSLSETKMSDEEKEELVKLLQDMVVKQKVNMIGQKLIIEELTPAADTSCKETQ
jgi:hypothetical protein